MDLKLHCVSWLHLNSLKDYHLLRPVAVTGLRLRCLIPAPRLYLIPALRRHGRLHTDDEACKSAFLVNGKAAGVLLPHREPMFQLKVECFHHVPAAAEK